MSWCDSSKRPSRPFCVARYNDFFATRIPAHTLYFRSYKNEANWTVIGRKRKIYENKSAFFERLLFGCSHSCRIRISNAGCHRETFISTIVHWDMPMTGRECKRTTIYAKYSAGKMPYVIDERVERREVNRIAYQELFLGINACFLRGDSRNLLQIQ